MSGAALWGGKDAWVVPCALLEINNLEGDKSVSLITLQCSVTLEGRKHPGEIINSEW